ncbi:hypothetical protein HAX54_017179, partial [Datura stramonium]|nr:hypothetical protein [Datura stramonium]
GDPGIAAELLVLYRRLGETSLIWHYTGVSPIFNRKARVRAVAQSLASRLRFNRRFTGPD